MSVCSVFNCARLSSLLYGLHNILREVQSHRRTIRVRKQHAMSNMLLDSQVLVLISPPKGSSKPFFRVSFTTRWLVIWLLCCLGYWFTLAMGQKVPDSFAMMIVSIHADVLWPIDRVDYQTYSWNCVFVTCSYSIFAFWMFQIK